MEVERTVNVRKTYELNIEKEGEGRVDIEPDQEKYVDGKEIILEAKPDENNYFSHWQGDAVDSSNSNISIIMDEDKSVTAHFGGTVKVTRTLKYDPVYIRSYFPVTLKVEGPEGITVNIEDNTAGIDHSYSPEPEFNDVQTGEEVTYDVFPRDTGVIEFEGNVIYDGKKLRILGDEEVEVVYP